jgi:hypothetical protein
VVAAAAPARATDEPATAPAPPAEEVSPPAEAEAGEGGGEAADTEPSGSADDAERVWISLLVKSTPPGARVELGRKPHGTTPVSVKVRSGTNYVFTFTHEGYRTATRRFKTTDKPGQQLAVTLERASPSKPTAAAGSSTAPSPPKAGDKTDKADKKKSWWQLKFDR